MQAFSDTDSLWSVPVEALADVKASMEEDFDDESQLEARTFGRVGVLRIDGLIQQRSVSGLRTGGVTAASIGSLFFDMQANPSIGSTVLRFDSRGGAMGGIAELSQRIFQARGRKPVIAFTDGALSGAAYALAAAADEIVASPSADSIGGIGIVHVHSEVSDQLRKLGIAITIIKSAPNKAEGNRLEPLREETRKLYQGRVDMAHANLVHAIAQFRNTTAQVVHQSYGKGRVHLASDALDVGMVDRIETFQQLIQRLSQN